MKHADVKKGMKVVPFRKTARGWCQLSESSAWFEARKAKQPFLYVHYFDEEEPAWVLGQRPFTKGNYCGDFFRASDFRPYES